MEMKSLIYIDTLKGNEDLEIQEHCVKYQRQSGAIILLKIFS